MDDNVFSPDADGKVLLKSLSFESVRNGAPAETRKVAAKYDFFIPEGHHGVISVDTTSCGITAGARETFEAVRKYIADHKLRFRAAESGSLGYISGEPVITVAVPGFCRLVFGKVFAEDVVKVLDSVLIEQKPLQEKVLGQYWRPAWGAKKWEGIPLIDDHPFFKGQIRHACSGCGVIDPFSLNDYLAHGGFGAFAKTLHTMIPSEVCDEIGKAGLPGLGGAGFPAARKWKAVLSRPAEQKYVVCNADEGDPAGYIDQMLIESNPHLLLEGLAIAAYAVGASVAYIFIRSEYTHACECLERSIAQEKAYGLIGENILDSGFSLDIVLRKSASAFICGEETALIRTLEGRRGEPQPRPPYPSEHGLNGAPTVVNNVETLINVPHILKDGAAAFASVGTAEEHGTKMFALSGSFRRIGVVEVAFGTPLKVLAENFGGGAIEGQQLKAFRIGGPIGGFVPVSQMDLPLSFKSLNSADAIIGSGSIAALTDHNCIIKEVRSNMDFLRRSSCGKCIPCREGTDMLWQILDTLTRNRNSEKPGDAIRRFRGVLSIKRIARVLQDSSLCGFGKNAAISVISSLRWFRDEYDAHIFNRRCPAGACHELAVYRIDAELCIGCGACAKTCPAKAISGKKRSAYHVDAKLCISCGLCRQACQFDAVRTTNL